MVSRVAENRRLLSRIVEVVRIEQHSGQLQGDSDAFAARIAALTIQLEALEATSLRLLSEADRGGVIGAQPSMLKLKGSELVQAMDEALFEAIGYWVAPLDTAVGAGDESIGPAHAQYLASARYHHRGYTIAGGSSEVQHNIIAKEVLGL
jgi:acyl-CoA dehydrogenase